MKAPNKIKQMQCSPKKMRKKCAKPLILCQNISIEWKWICIVGRHHRVLFITVCCEKSSTLSTQTSKSLCSQQKGSVNRKFLNGLLVLPSAFLARYFLFSFSFSSHLVHSHHSGAAVRDIFFLMMYWLLRTNYIYFVSNPSWAGRWTKFSSLQWLKKCR